MSFRTHTQTFIDVKFVDFGAEFSRLSEGLKSPWERGDERLGLEAGMELVFKKSNLQTAEQLGNHWLSVKSVYLLLSGHREPQKLLKPEKWQRAAD